MTKKVSFLIVRPEIVSCILQLVIGERWTLELVKENSLWIFPDNPNA